MTTRASLRLVAPLSALLECGAEAFETNTYGAVRVTEAFRLCFAGRWGRHRARASESGSLAGMRVERRPTAFEGFAQRAHKDARGEFTRRPRAVNRLPRWVATEMGGRGAPRSVEDGRGRRGRAATLPDSGPTCASSRRRAVPCDQLPTAQPCCRFLRRSPCRSSKRGSLAGNESPSVVDLGFAHPVLAPRGPSCSPSSAAFDKEHLLKNSLRLFVRRDQALFVVHDDTSTPLKELLAKPARRAGSLFSAAGPTFPDDSTSSCPLLSALRILVVLLSPSIICSRDICQVLPLLLRCFSSNSRMQGRCLNGESGAPDLHTFSLRATTVALIVARTISASKPVSRNSRNHSARGNSPQICRSCSTRAGWLPSRSR